MTNVVIIMLLFDYMTVLTIRLYDCKAIYYGLESDEEYSNDWSAIDNECRLSLDQTFKHPVRPFFVQHQTRIVISILKMFSSLN